MTVGINFVDYQNQLTMFIDCSTKPALADGQISAKINFHKGFIFAIFVGKYCISRVFIFFRFIQPRTSPWFNLYLNLDTYVYTLIISLIPGLIFIFKQKDELKISIFDKIFTVILGYVFLPLIIALPYFLSIYNISFIDCYFE